VSRAILDAARDLFVAEGYQNVSIRKIADRIEYSPAAIYSYFPSKDDIFYALAEEGFRLLFSVSQERGDPGPDGLECLRRGFMRLYQFSREHPEYFALMFLDRSVPRITQNWAGFSFVSSIKQDFAARIDDAVRAGHLPAATDAHAVFRLLTAATVGASVLHLCNRLAPGDDADALARDTIEAVITGLRSGFAQNFHPSPCGSPSGQ
jgi:AcrR family transcriptional regulator